MNIGVLNKAQLSPEHQLMNHPAAYPPWGHWLVAVLHDPQWWHFKQRLQVQTSLKLLDLEVWNSYKGSHIIENDRRTCIMFPTWATHQGKKITCKHKMTGSPYHEYSPLWNYSTGKSEHLQVWNGDGLDKCVIMKCQKLFYCCHVKSPLTW